MTGAGSAESRTGVAAAKAAEKTTNSERSKVLTTFRFAKAEFEAADESLLTPEQKAAKKGIAEAAQKTVDANPLKNRFRVQFEDTENPGRQFTEYESIPVDELIDFLRSRFSDSSVIGPKRKEYQKAARVLEQHSKSFSEIGSRMQPDKYLARLQLEAYYISQDERSTGSSQGDFLKAVNALTRRRELVLPAKPKTARAITADIVTAPAPTEPVTTGTIIAANATHDALPLPETTVPPDAIEAPETTPPPAEPTEEEIDEDHIATPASAEQVVREFVIVNGLLRIRKSAQELAEEQLRTEMKKGSIFNPRALFRKIRLRLGEEYYRQKYTERARQAMLANDNSFLEMDVVRNAVIDANAKITQERAEEAAKIEQVQTGAELSGQTVTEAQGPLKQMLLDEIILPLVNDPTLNHAVIQQKLREFVISHQEDPTIQEFFGRDATKYNELTDYFASNVETMAQRVREDLTANRYSLAQIDQMVKIKLATASWAAETETRFTLADRAIAWSQGGTKRGLLVNPATVGIAISLAALPKTGALKAIGLGAGAGAVVAALRRNRDLKIDMASQRVDRAYSRQIEPGAKRREALERYAYDTASVSALLDRGAADRKTLGNEHRSLHELMALDLSETSLSNREAVLQRIAEIQTRLDYSAMQQVDLVTFSSKGEVEQGRLALIKGVIEARRALKAAYLKDTDAPKQKPDEPDSEFQQRMTEFEAGINNTMQDRELYWKGQWENRFIQDRQHQDRAFQVYRLRNAAGAGVFGGITGLTGGLISQEAFATIARATGVNVGQTVLENMLGIKPHEAIPTTSTVPKPDIFQTGGSEKLGNGFSLNVDPTTHNITVLDGTNHPVPGLTGLKLNANDGAISGAANMPIPPEAKQALLDSHFEIVNESTNVTPGEIEQLHVSNETLKHLGTPVAHRQWYAYDLPKSQGNELRLYDSYNAKTGVVTLDMSHMRLGYQSGLRPNPIDVQQAIKKGETGFAFSLPSTYGKPIWIPTDSHGMLHLDPHSTAFLKDANGHDTKITMKDFYNMVINKHALAGAKTGNLATEVHHTQNVFNLGDGKGNWGRIEAGRMVTNSDGSRTLQAFATIRGSGKLPSTIPVQGPTTTTYSFTVKPPIETPPVIVPPVETPPPFATYEARFIVTPFAPRHPLEEMKRTLAMYGYGREYSAGSFGLLDRGANDSGYRNRRSPTLIDNPEAVLDEKQETKRYLESLTPDYKRTLESLNQPLPLMNENCRVVITIPAYGEGSNIFKTLAQFVDQKTQNSSPLNPSTYEIIIVDNHPASVPKDTMESEVQRFKILHPEINIQYAEKVWGENEVASVGNARKYAADLALLRNYQRPGSHGDLILVSFDADVDGINDNYVSDVLTEFDTNPKLDTAAGKWNLPKEALSKPNIRAAQRLWYTLDRLIQRDAEGNPSERELRNPGLIGRNAAIRASMYAGIGGYNPNAKIAEDLELGWMADSARGYDSARKGRTGFINTAEVISNPRRFLAAQIQGIPLVQMYGGFHENTSIRAQNNQELLPQISDTFNVKDFEREADGLWQAWKTGQYSWLGERFKPLFERAMGLMGTEYRIENDHVVITNAKKLTDGLTRARTAQPISIPVSPTVASQPIQTEALESSIPITQATESQLATPKQTEPRGLINRIKETLTSATKDTSHVDTAPAEISEFLKTLSLPMGAKIKEISTLSISSGALNTQGEISSPAGNITFSASFVNQPGGGIKIDKYNVALPFLARGMRGQIESQIQNLNTLIINQLNNSIDPDWETNTLQITGDKIGIDFRKR